MSDKPSVLLICTDHWSGLLTRRAGHPVVILPMVEQLSRNGVTFTNAYSACPSCIPARRTLMTGMTARSHGDRSLLETNPFPEVPHAGPVLSGRRLSSLRRGQAPRLSSTEPDRVRRGDLGGAGTPPSGGPGRRLRALSRGPGLWGDGVRRRNGPQRLPGQALASARTLPSHQLGSKRDVPGDPAQGPAQAGLLVPFLLGAPPTPYAPSGLPGPVP